MRTTLKLLVILAAFSSSPAWGKCYFWVSADLISGGRTWNFISPTSFQLIPGDVVRVTFTDFTPGACPAWTQHAQIFNGDTIHPDGPMIVFVDQPGIHRFVTHEFGDTMAIAELDFEIRPYDPTPVASQILIRALLGGSLATSSGPNQSMRKDLGQAGLLPTSEPYSTMGYLVTQNEGMVANTTLTGPFSFSNVVDWVLLELRDVNDPGIVLHSCPGLLYANSICWTNVLVPAGHYNVVLRHRNHLGILFAHPVPISDHGIQIDMRNPGLIHPLTQFITIPSGQAAMVPGNVIPDTVIRYLGSGNDRDAILSAIGGTTPTATISGYHNADVNMDGQVKYVGASNDRDVILQMIGGSTPTQVLTQPLPW
ncbi:MAG: hypothetical protein JNM31_08255 [Flavobacteriales bacterium]|nr:hypothetical protein [Flavobacteriales bacterium]